MRDVKEVELELIPWYLQEFLIEQGHDAEFISRNNDWETPLMLAAIAGKEDMGVMLAKRFPESIPMQDKNGMDAVCLLLLPPPLSTTSITSPPPTPFPHQTNARTQLMHASLTGTGTHLLIPTLVTLDPSILTLSDNMGNTALHHASAAGELKALRLLLQYGANPLTPNACQWTPVHYSASAQAEAYFKTLIIEFEKKKAEEARGKRERERQRLGGVRLVTSNDEGASNMGMNGGGVGGGSNGNMNGMNGMNAPGDRQRARDDAAIAGLPKPGIEWSPVPRRAMTPTEGRSGWFADAGRPRAGSGD
jgi:ankyrin repeat protein